MSASVSAALPIVLTRQGMTRGAQNLLPVSVFVLPFGIAFGATAIETGMTADQALVMSFIVFAGVSQFAALDLWAAPLPWMSLALVVLAVNARHFILGAALAPYVNQLGRGHWFMSLMLLSDANFADGHQRLKAGERDVGYVLGGGLIMWAVWALATAIGIFAGSALGDLDRFGVDVVMAAFFASLIISGLPTLRHAVPVAAACVVAVVTLPLLPTGWNIIVAALAGGFVGVLYDPKGREDEATH